MKKKYRLKKDISSPMGFAPAGTESIRSGDFFVFPYQDANGQPKKNELPNGWFGNGYMVGSPGGILDDTEWYEEVI